MKFLLRQVRSCLIEQVILITFKAGRTSALALSSSKLLGSLSTSDTIKTACDGLSRQDHEHNQLWRPSRKP